MAACARFARSGEHGLASLSRVGHQETLCGIERQLMEKSGCLWPRWLTMTKPSKEDLAAKRRFIEAFFDELRSRIDFLHELRSADHENEAMLLCCCYIDGLAGYLYWPDSRSHQNFVRAVREFSPHDFLSRIHPEQLRQAIARMRGKKARSALRAAAALEDEAGGALLNPEALQAALEAHAEPAVREWIANNIWRGTLASIAYEGLRVPSVHSLGAPGGITFSNATLDNEPAPDIDFKTLMESLEPMYEEARRRSIDTNKWFGHDLKESDTA